ncbi:hypothetical protein BDFB_014505 [Asbolus verrucosus]|uniref:Uncharacterized protein n=1 Tax=Asbolus verrucosus TaxID=1661398 RepID=A0A482VJE2_ASBVE|nr:hypothetical protein BDFB_014505 [Asbolus verrucosus]
MPLVREYRTKLLRFD